MMQKILKKFVITFLLLGVYRHCFSQSPADSTATPSPGIMMSHDKIYVVMAVCVTILAGLFLYLIRIDRKVSKKEKLS